MSTTAPFDIGEFIAVDPAWHGGWPFIRGKRVTVARIGILHGQGMSAEEIGQDYDFLTPAEIHAALCYYHANRDEIEAALERDDERERPDARAWREGTWRPPA